MIWLREPYASMIRGAEPRCCLHDPGCSDPFMCELRAAMLEPIRDDGRDWSVDP